MKITLRVFFLLTLSGLVSGAAIVANAVLLVPQLDDFYSRLAVSAMGFFLVNSANKRVSRWIFDSERERYERRRRRAA